VTELNPVANIKLILAAAAGPAPEELLKFF